jgi:SAM-dependent methyltransferase
MPERLPNADGDRYYGLIAAGYDSYLAYVAFGDVEVFQRLAAAAPALELACGTGRLLVPLRAAGLDVEGLDASAEMLALCRHKAHAAGVAVTLHHAAMERFSLPRRYGAIFCAASSLMLLTRPASLAAALANAHAHLAPGGVFAATMERPADERWSGWRWRRRGARADGARYRVRERWLAPPSPDLDRREMETCLLRGRRVMQRQRSVLDLRPLAPQAFAAALRDAGFGAIELFDVSSTRPVEAADAGYLAVATRIAPCDKSA